MKIKIEKGVPLPDASNGRPCSVHRQALRKMEVGDSFVTSIKATTLRSLAWNEKKETGKAFTTRLLDDGRIRIWRTA